MTLPWLSEEENFIKDTAERFAREQLAEGYMGRAKDEVLDRDLLRKMGQLGLIAPIFAEENGGISASSMVQGVICEAIAYADINLSYICMTTPLIGCVIEKYGSAETREEVLPKMAAGELIVQLGLTEPRGGSDAANLIVKATKKGDKYILNGEKTSISYGAQAEMSLLFARTDQDTPGAHGVSAFLVPLDLPGVTCTRFDDVGSSSVGRGSVFFDDVEIPASALLGNEGEGFTKVMAGFDLSRFLIALQCLACAQASVDETWQYIQEREAFGKPLAKFQGTTFPLAEHESRLAAVRALCYQGLALRDQGLPHTKEAAMVKWMAPKWGTDIIHECLVQHGHYGWGHEMPHMQRMIDVMGLQIGDGTAQIMKTIVTRETIGSIGVAYK
ncbi:MAG: acyl-CoA dehydrogenase family protein [Gammaproteobacteria bacterium]|nr:acyl-CoA dehydrogenase family protein [Gammaproteobacteria bacterium]MBQ0838402.1 acyl-CoA dehydrogenase family protein [Gammaproteobacteria bacterium]